MNVLDLFSGIGGFSLGLERAEMRTVAFCEIEPFCRAVLRKHWPNVPIYEDVRSLTAERLAADGIAVDVICGGFPCQDISTAGSKLGIAGERSGLWREYARLVGELRPRFVIVENVAALLGRGLGEVLGDLAALRYDAEWHCIPASAVGAPHRRDRVWIVAYADSLRKPQSQGGQQNKWGWSGNGGKEAVPTFDRSSMAYSASQRQPGSGESVQQFRATSLIDWQANFPFPERVGNVWRTEPNVGRVADGVPSRVDRLKGLGNAVVPQIPELIGRAIMRGLT